MHLAGGRNASSEPQSVVGLTAMEPSRAVGRFDASTAVFQAAGSARIAKSLAVGSDELATPLSVRSQDIEIPATYLNGEEVLVEGDDAVVGVYSSEAGSAGSAVVFGETVDGSSISNEKWAIVRETTGGGSDLRFTFGSNANYFTNPARFEIGDDGVLHNAAVPVVWGSVTPSSSTIVSGSGNFTLSLGSDGTGDYTVIASPDFSCSDDPIVLAATREFLLYRTTQTACSTELRFYTFGPVGLASRRPFSFAVYVPD